MVPGQKGVKWRGFKMWSGRWPGLEKGRGESGDTMIRVLWGQKGR